jgi:hypothetical protein
MGEALGVPVSVGLAGNTVNETVPDVAFHSIRRERKSVAGRLNDRKG